MTSILKIKLKTILFSLFLVSLISLPAISQAFEFKDSLKEAGNSAGYDKTSQLATDPIVLLQRPITMVLSLVGVIFLVLMIYGGFLWMSAKGDTKQVDKAKDIVEAAVIGLVVISAAYAISVFVMARLGGVGGATLQ